MLHVKLKKLKTTNKNKPKRRENNKRNRQRTLMKNGRLSKEKKNDRQL